MKRPTKVEQILFLLLIVLLPAQIGKHFWPPTAFVRGIRIDYLSPTIFATDLILIAMLISWAARARGKTIVNILEKHKRSIGVFIALLLLMALNIAISTNPLSTLYYWLRLGELALLFFYLKSVPKSTTGALRKLLPLPVIYSSTIAIIQFVKQGSVGGLLYWLGERSFTIATPGIAKAESLGRLLLRPYATFPHPNALAGFIVVSLVLLLPLMERKQGRDTYTKVVLPLAFILGAITLLLTFSLSGWIAAALLAILAKALKDKRKMLPSAALVVLGLTVAVVAFPPEKESISNRLTVAKHAQTMIRESPLTGVGLGNFIPSLSQQPNQGSLPLQSPFLFYQPVHNIYLLLAAEAGLIALGLFAWFMAGALRNAKRKERTNIFLALVGILMIGAVDHYWLTLHQTRLLFTITLALAWRKENS